MNLGNGFLSTVKIVFPTIAISILVAWCSMGCQVSFHAGYSDITEAGTCKGLAPDGTPAGVTNKFPPDTERIYVYFCLAGDIPTRVTFRWYYEDQFIGEVGNYYQPGLNYTYFSQKTKRYLSEGKYKVEIFMGNELLKTLQLSVQGEKTS